MTTTPPTPPTPEPEELRALLGVLAGLRAIAEGRLAGLPIAPEEYLADIYCIQRVAGLLAMELSALGRTLRRAETRAAEDEVHRIEQILAHHPRPGSLFNVNLPSPERGPVRGVRAVPQNVASYSERFDRRIDPRGRVYFWSTPEFGCPEPHPDTDVTALAEGYVTVTPLQFDLTHQRQLEEMDGWDW